LASGGYGGPLTGRLAQAASPGDPWAGAVYFTLDRFLARPALERDLARADLVLSDRSLYSTLAYQGSALGPALRARLEELGPRATVLPDRVVLLELPVAEALRRVGVRAAARGPLERRRTLDRVARRYRRLAQLGGWIVVDARRPTAELVEAVTARLPTRPRLARRRTARARAQRT
jgi:thymidylate kinase